MPNLRRKTVQVDTNSVTGKNMTETDSTTLSVTVADKPNRVSVLVNCNRGTTGRITAISRDGVNYTLAKRSTAINNCFAEIWYLVNPVADTGNISITFNGASSSAALLGHVCLYNVDLFDPIDITDELTGDASSFSNSFTATENNCVAVDGMFTSTSEGVTQASGQTLIYKRTSNDCGGCSYETNIDAGTEAMGWSMGGSDYYSQAVVVFQGALTSGGALILLNL